MVREILERSVKNWNCSWNIEIHRKLLALFVNYSHCSWYIYKYILNNLAFAHNGWEGKKAECSVSIIRLLLYQELLAEPRENMERRVKRFLQGLARWRSDSINLNKQCEQDCVHYYRWYFSVLSTSYTLTSAYTNTYKFTLIYILKYAHIPGYSCNFLYRRCYVIRVEVSVAIYDPQGPVVESQTRQSGQRHSITSCLFWT